MLHLVGSLGQRTGVLARDGLAGLLVLALCAGPAFGEQPSPESQARALADEVLHKAGEAGPQGLGEWTRSVIGRALERAGDAATGTAGRAGPATPAETRPAPLPAERHAASVKAGLSDRGGSTAEIVVFMSLSVPAPSWREWAREAAAIGAPLVLRGVGEGGLRQTVKAVGERLGGAEAGVAVDPRLFRLFGIDRVPAVVVAPGGIAGCASRGCADDPAPPHDMVTGNIGLAAALEAIAAEGEAAREVARARLERLGGGQRP